MMVLLLLPFVIAVVVLPFLVVFAMIKLWLPPLLLLVVAIGSWIISLIASALIPDVKAGPELITPFGVLVGLVAFSTRRLMLSRDEEREATARPLESVLWLVMILSVVIIVCVDLFFAAWGRQFDPLGVFFGVLGGSKVVIAVGALVGLAAFATPRRWI
jgi:hypothetical protein